MFKNTIQIFCFEDFWADGNGVCKSCAVINTTPNWTSGGGAKNISSFLGLINEQSLFMGLYFLSFFFLFFVKSASKCRQVQADRDFLMLQLASAMRSESGRNFDLHRQAGFLHPEPSRLGPPGWKICFFFFFIINASPTHLSEIGGKKG